MRQSVKRKQIMKKTILTSLSVIFLTGISFSQITAPAPYCDAKFDDGATDDMEPFPVSSFIGGVTFGTLNNQSNGQYAAPHYVFYNNLPTANFIKGTAYTLTLKMSPAGGTGYGVWIDYNRNNQFEANEKVAGTTGQDWLPMEENTIVTKSITIPATAVTGTTRMRVRIVEDDNRHSGPAGSSELACNATTGFLDVMDWGETEDYTINITGNATTGISDIDLEAFNLYPSPFNETLTIEFSGTPSNADHIEIYNLQGQLIQSIAVTGKSKTEIETAGMISGTYIVQLHSNGQTFSRKITKI